MNDKIPFSDAFVNPQYKNVPAHSQQSVFYGKIPHGRVGFLTGISLSQTAYIDWLWFIDGEYLGEVAEGVFTPPYLIKDDIEFKATNNNDDELKLGVLCSGECYLLPSQITDEWRELKAVQMENVNLLADIRNELRVKTPKGETTDESVAVTDVVYMVWDEANHGLDWTSCGIKNLGPNDVYIAVNKWEQPEAALEVGEVENIDLGRQGAIKKIYLVCDSGETATINLHALK